MEAMVQPIRIDDKDDLRIAGYHAIRERDLVGREGLFIAEGRVTVGMLLRNRRFCARSILLLDNRCAGFLDAHGDAIPPGVPVYSASRAVMDLIAGFPMHRGVLALGERPESVSDPERLLASLAAHSVIVVACGIANHDNIGAIFRNAAAFGAAAVVMDETCCDPLYRKAIRVSAGGVFLVPFACGGSIPSLLDQVQASGFDIVTLSPAGAEQLASVQARGKTALVLGSEGDGLPQSVLATTRSVAIPMAAGFDSVNVATAGAIALAHLFAGRQAG
jgi:tRNA G18 (ribose-2'-O)-methylase SpoU